MEVEMSFRVLTVSLVIASGCTDGAQPCTNQVTPAEIADASALVEAALANDPIIPVDSFNRTFELSKTEKCNAVIRITYRPKKRPFGEAQIVGGAQVFAVNLTSKQVDLIYSED
jgi:hypothetical protein